jgi:hypothetical protein
MERGNGAASEARLVASFLRWLDLHLPTVEPDSPSARLLRGIGDDLAAHYRMPRDGARSGDLDQAQEEVIARLRDAGAELWVPPSAEQWRTFGAGLPFTQDELADCSARSVAEFLPNANGRPKVVIAQGMHSCGVIKGALVQSWRR